MATEQNNHDHITAVALRAIALAQFHNHDSVKLEHVLAALLERPEIQKCFKDLGIDAIVIQDELNKCLSSLNQDQVPTPYVPTRTKEFDVVIGRTIAYAQFSPRRFPTGLDVLFQLIQLSDSPAVSLVAHAGLELRKLKHYIQGQQRQSHSRDGEYSNDVEPTDKTEAITFIKKYCIDLNELASLGKIDPVVGRSDEIERIVQIISRRPKNNVVLIGDAGVGKTAVIEGFALNIVQGNVPSIIKKSIIWSLDVGALVAGTRFRGDFEERMKFLLKAFSIIEEDDPILFIDEIHMIMDAGSGNKGSLDVSNLLKPVLARGKLRCIGSTTEQDWRQHFEKDSCTSSTF